jgi:tRNA dimethylallyltransferase
MGDIASAGAPAGPATRPLVVLVGPTAVGKTEVAIDLAEALDAEIVSADSRYLYRGMDIGTAKPSPEEQASVPHHLIDVTTPDRPWTLAQFQAAAYEAIEAIRARGRLALLVGGTGQYVRAMVEGWRVPTGEPDAGLRRELESLLARKGIGALVERLEAVDPDSARRIDLMNPRRVIRALEVALRTGASFVAQRRRSSPPYPIRMLGLTRSRAELYDRIDSRVDRMIADGLVEEVRCLTERGYGWELPAMSAIGYRQIGEYLRGECSLEEAVRRIKRATRQFVRRQANWFKADDPAIRWFNAGPGVAAELAAHLQAGEPE